MSILIHNPKLTHAEIIGNGGRYWKYHQEVQNQGMNIHRNMKISRMSKRRWRRWNTKSLR